jgi:hypothetical protein
MVLIVALLIKDMVERLSTNKRIQKRIKVIDKLNILNRTRNNKMILIEKHLCFL